MTNNNKQYRHSGVDEINSIKSRLETIEKYRVQCNSLNDEQIACEELFLNGLEEKPNLDCFEMMQLRNQKR